MSSFNAIANIWIFSGITKVVSVTTSVVCVNCVGLEVYGYHTITLGLINNICSWPRTEYVRSILLRCIGSSDELAQEPMLQLATYVTSVICFLTTIVAFKNLPTHLDVGVWCLQFTTLAYSCSAVLDVIQERYDLYICSRGMVLEKTKIDSKSAFLSQSLLTGSTLSMFIFGGSPRHIKTTFILASGISRLVSAGLLLLAKRHLSPENLHVNNWNWNALCRMKKMLWIEALASAQKFVVAEGEKFLMLYLLSERQRGAVGSAWNLAGMIVQVFFAPNEAAVRAAYCNKSAQIKANPYDALEFFRISAIPQITVALLASVYISQFSQSFLQILRGDAYRVDEAIALKWILTLLLPMAISGMTDGLLHVSAPVHAYARIQKHSFYAWIGACSALLIYCNNNGVSFATWFLFNWTVQFWRLVISLITTCQIFSFGSWFQLYYVTVDPLLRYVALILCVVGITIPTMRYWCKPFENHFSQSKVIVGDWLAGIVCTGLTIVLLLVPKLVRKILN